MTHRVDLTSVTLSRKVPHQPNRADYRCVEGVQFFGGYPQFLMDLLWTT